MWGIWPGYRGASHQAALRAEPVGSSGRRGLLRRCPGQRHRIVVEHRREPLLRLLDAPALAFGVVLDLVALDLADAEIVALRVAEIEPAHRCARPHRKALRELDPDAALAVEQVEQGRLLAVIGLRGIARRRA